VALTLVPGVALPGTVTFIATLVCSPTDRFVPSGSGEASPTSSVFAKSRTSAEAEPSLASV
jgi:hypothetical protein